MHLMTKAFPVTAGQPQGYEEGGKGTGLKKLIWTMNPSRGEVRSDPAGCPQSEQL